MKNLNKEILIELVSSLSVTQTGKLFKALAAYLDGENYTQHLNENIYPTFILLANYFN
ncbi:MAG: hypothetical protein ACI4MC_07245 [Candidatus Coproplasma sp.]